MIDYIKFDRLNLKTNFRANKILEPYWKTVVNNHGEVVSERVEFKGLKFEIFKGKFSGKYHSKVSGSLHKYFNNGLHNHNDFCFSNIIKTIEQWESLFKICPKTDISNIEFGVNIVLPCKISKILDNLVIHKGKKFTHVTNDTQNYYQCEHSQFIVKIYDKGLQFGLEQNIMRFEIKVTKMHYLRKIGISSMNLNSLKQKALYEPLGTLLLKVFNEVIINCEAINESKLSQSESIIYHKAINPLSWHSTEKRIDKEQKKLERLLVSYNLLVLKLSSTPLIKDLVSNEIKNKWYDLSDFYPPKGSQFINQFVGNLPTSNFNKQNPFVGILPFNYRVNFRHPISFRNHHPIFHNREF